MNACFGQRRMIHRNTSKHPLDLCVKLAQSLAKGPESSMNKTTVDVSTAVRSAGAWCSPARFASRERKLTHALDSPHPAMGTAGRRVPARGSARRPPVQRGGTRARRRPRCRATSTPRAARRAKRPTAQPARYSPPTTARCTRSSGPRTAASSTSACNRPAGSSTQRLRSHSAPAPPAPSPSCTTRAPTEQHANLAWNLLLRVLGRDLRPRPRRLRYRFPGHVAASDGRRPAAYGALFDAQGRDTASTTPRTSPPARSQRAFTC